MLYDKKAVCPNDPNHKRFVTVGHVSQDWLVDQSGSFVEQVGPDLEVVADVDEGNTWTCNECGADAVFEKVEG